MPKFFENRMVARSFSRFFSSRQGLGLNGCLRNLNLKGARAGVQIADGASGLCRHFAGPFGRA